jgi:hypothetical protein
LLHQKKKKKKKKKKNRQVIVVVIIVLWRCPVRTSVGTPASLRLILGYLRKILGHDLDEVTTIFLQIFSY